VSSDPIALVGKHSKKPFSVVIESRRRSGFCPIVSRFPSPPGWGDSCHVIRHIGLCLYVSAGGEHLKVEDDPGFERAIPDGPVRKMTIKDQ